MGGTGAVATSTITSFSYLEVNNIEYGSLLSTSTRHINPFGVSYAPSLQRTTEFYCDEMPLLTTLITGKFVRFRISEADNCWSSWNLSSITFLYPITSGYWKTVIDHCADRLISLTDTSLSVVDMVYLSTRTINLERLCLHQCTIGDQFISTMSCLTNLAQLEIKDHLRLMDDDDDFNYQPLTSLIKLTSIIIMQSDIATEDSHREWRLRSIDVKDPPSFVALVMHLSSSINPELAHALSSSPSLIDTNNDHTGQLRPQCSNGQLVHVNGAPVATYLDKQSKWT
jgi:hypothetical protein